jgi:hypothetical protein
MRYGMVFPMMVVVVYFLCCSIRVDPHFHMQLALYNWYAFDWASRIAQHFLQLVGLKKKRGWTL